MKYIILFLLASCAATNSEWRAAVLNERTETLNCIKQICDADMTVAHCLSLAERICE